MYEFEEIGKIVDAAQVKVKQQLLTLQGTNVVEDENRVKLVEGTVGQYHQPGGGDYAFNPTLGIFSQTSQPSPSRVFRA